MSVDTNLVKKPYLEEQYTKKQIGELIACNQDPFHFIEEYCYIQHPTQGRLPFKLFDYQKDLINVYHNYRYSIAMLARQLGKSTCAAAYLLWYAMFRPDSTILIAAHKYSGAQEIMNRIRYMYESCPDFIRAGAVSYNKGSLEFDNGSRIIAQATTENTGRGLSLTLVYLDEFAFVPLRVAQEFWTSLSPTLSTGGKCFITSTPNQDSDQFAQIWNQATKTIDEHGNDTDVGINGFKNIKVTWEAHPDRDEEWAENEKAKIGDARFRREHLCEFITADETLVSPLKLLELEGAPPLFKTGEVRWFKKPKDFDTFIVGLDPSLGTGGDPAGLQVYGLPGMEQVAEWRHNQTPIKSQINLMLKILEYLEDESPDAEIYWSVENNTLGEAALVVIEEIGEDEFPGIFISEKKKRGRQRSSRKGFSTTGKSKILACMRFKRLVEADNIEISSNALVREVKVFVAHGSAYAAKTGETDDLVMSSLLCVRILEEISDYDEDAYDTLLSDYDDEDDDDAPLPFMV